MAAKLEIYNHFFHIKMTGITDKFLYYVSESEVDRFKSFLEDLTFTNTELDSDRFYCFKTLEKINVSIPIKKIQYVNFLQETKNTTIKIETKSDFDLNVYFSENGNIFKVNFDDEDSLCSLFFLLDIGLINDEPFFNFIDDDGESVSINLFDPVMFEFNSEKLKIGEEKLKNETQD